MAQDLLVPLWFRKRWIGLTLIPPSGSSDRKSAWMTRRYGIGLTVVGLLATSTFLFEQRITAENASTAAVVNVAGRQRMLSQRTGMATLELLNARPGPLRAERAAAIAGLAGEMETAWRGLVHGDHARGLPGRLPAQVQAEYDRGDGIALLLPRFVDLARTLAGNPQAPDAGAASELVALARGPLLAALEAAVAAHEAAGQRVVARLHTMQLGSLILLFITLLAEILLIFRPMVRTTIAQFSEVERLVEALGKSNMRLEETVLERTQDLIEARDEAMRAARSKSRFLAAASHDLQQPLDAFGMFLAAFERQATPTQAEVLNDLRNAQRSMKAILDSILQMSKIEAGVVKPAWDDVPLQKLLLQLAAEYGPQATAKGLRLSVVLSSLSVRSDPLLLERILRNLLANAIRYTRAGKILLGVRRVGGMARIEVHDTGVGIDETDLERIFGEFIQLDVAGRDRSEGIGLGLSIARGLARLLDHPLQVRSALGEGTCFALRVPALPTVAGAGQLTEPPTTLGR